MKTKQTMNVGTEHEHHPFRLWSSLDGGHRPRRGETRSSDFLQAGLLVLHTCDEGHPTIVRDSLHDWGMLARLDVDLMTGFQGR